MSSLRPSRFPGRITSVPRRARAARDEDATTADYSSGIGRLLRGDGRLLSVIDRGDSCSDPNPRAPRRRCPNLLFEVRRYFARVYFSPDSTRQPSMSPGPVLDLPLCEIAFGATGRSGPRRAMTRSGVLKDSPPQGGVKTYEHDIQGIGTMPLRWGLLPGLRRPPGRLQLPLPPLPTLHRSSHGRHSRQCR